MAGKMVGKTAKKRTRGGSLDARLGTNIKGDIPIVGYNEMKSGTGKGKMGEAVRIPTSADIASLDRATASPANTRSRRSATKTKAKKKR